LSECCAIIVKIRSWSLTVYTFVGKIYKYTRVHIPGLAMVNAIIILQKKALLELHNRVLGKKEPKRLPLWVGFEMG